MKEVINGKVYNTETATEVAEYWNQLAHGNFYYFEENLFITKKGSWFLYGKGGAYSKYGTCYGNYSKWGEKIIPLTEEEAFKWCEKYNELEAIEEYFPDYIEEA